MVEHWTTKHKITVFLGFGPKWRI